MKLNFKAAAQYFALVLLTWITGGVVIAGVSVGSSDWSLPLRLSVGPFFGEVTGVSPDFAAIASVATVLIAIWITINSHSIVQGAIRAVAAIAVTTAAITVLSLQNPQLTNQLALWHSERILVLLLWISIRVLLFLFGIIGICYIVKSTFKRTEIRLQVTELERTLGLLIVASVIAISVCVSKVFALPLNALTNGVFATQLLTWVALTITIHQLLIRGQPWQRVVVLCSCVLVAYSVIYFIRSASFTFAITNPESLYDRLAWLTTFGSGINSLLEGLLFVSSSVGVAKVASTDRTSKREAKKRVSIEKARS